MLRKVIQRFRRRRRRRRKKRERERKQQSDTSAVLHKLHVCLLVWTTAWSGCKDYGRRLILPPQAVARLGTCGSSYMLISTCGERGGWEGRREQKTPAGLYSRDTCTDLHCASPRLENPDERNYHSNATLEKLANNLHWQQMKVVIWVLFVRYLHLSCCVMGRTVISCSKVLPLFKCEQTCYRCRSCRNRFPCRVPQKCKCQISETQMDLNETVHTS